VLQAPGPKACAFGQLPSQYLVCLRGHPA
jgi:hypothetical protein